MSGAIDKVSGPIGQAQDRTVDLIGLANAQIHAATSPMISRITATGKIMDIITETIGMGATRHGLSLPASRWAR